MNKYEKFLIKTLKMSDFIEEMQWSDESMEPIFFYGNDLSEWYRHFDISDTIVASFDELGVEDVRDIKYLDENDFLFIESRISPDEYHLLKRYIEYTNPDDLSHLENASIHEKSMRSELRQKD